MPVEVPKEAKVYSTVYDNFRGVDRTNDMSNVWKRRSPDGKNMLPDLDGRPYKRKGWEVVLTPADFKTAAGITGNVPVVTDKTYYFEIGGYDYIMVFNNLGVFTYSVNPLTGSSSEVFPTLLVHHDKYVDVNGQQQNFPPSGCGPIDARRGFFFEGGGTAGFYLFVGIKLFRYDGAYFHEVDPYTPIILIGCAPNGAGTALEQVNLINAKRIVQYTCDGTTDPDSGQVTGSTSFTIPGGISSDFTPIVEVRNATTGDWQAASGYTVDYTNGKIDFTSAPIQTYVGEDNLRVTYVSKDASATATENTVTQKQKIISITRTRTQTRTKKGPKGTPTAWSTTSTTYTKESQSFDTSGVKINTSTNVKDCTVQCRHTGSSAWGTMESEYFSEKWGSYSNEVTITPNNAIFSSTVSPSSSESSESIKDWKVKSKNKSKKNATWTYEQTRTIIERKKYPVRIQYTQYKFNTGSSTNPAVTAFSQCSKSLVFGSGIINQAFMTASPYEEYNTRVWYSKATDPSYWPDTNYIEVGATDKPIMGLLKIGEYLGVIKKGTSTGTSIYLAYPTSFDDDTTYAVKQNVNGIGAVSCGAFNSLNEEPLFLSENGVMGIEVSEDDTDRQIRNRSFYVNKPLCAEDALSQAISFVHDGMYYLCINNRCYVLDGSQKNSWQNTKTNLQYEAYVLNNIPAQCFCKYNGELWFADYKGNLCRFMTDKDPLPYHDAYSLGDPTWYTVALPINGKVYISNLTAFDGSERTPKAGDIVKWNTTDLWYTITSVDSTYVYLADGVPIDAVWSTIADDDGAPHFFKNLQKKGCLVSLLPSSDSGVNVYVKADEDDPIHVGTTDAKDYELPYDYYVKKKVKKYKRLQFICENNEINDSFGLDQIIKSYTIGNYSKNKG